MDRAVVNEFNKFPERNRFIPGLRAWLGFRQASVMYDRKDRAAGKPKQTLRRLIKYAVDGDAQLQHQAAARRDVAGLRRFRRRVPAGRLLLHRLPPPPRKYGSGFTTLILCLLFLGGVQLITIGILGEYIGRMYEEIKQRPLYVVSEKLGFE
jgi:dolichol-phosphate mannosyltransferase